MYKVNRTEVINDVVESVEIKTTNEGAKIILACLQCDTDTIKHNAKLKGINLNEERLRESMTRLRMAFEMIFLELDN